MDKELTNEGLDDLARYAYEAYCETRQWKSYRNEPLPQWPLVEELIKIGWRAAANAVILCFQE